MFKCKCCRKIFPYGEVVNLGFAYYCHPCRDEVFDFKTKCDFVYTDRTNNKIIICNQAEPHFRMFKIEGKWLCEKHFFHWNMKNNLQFAHYERQKLGLSSRYLNPR